MSGRDPADCISETQTKEIDPQLLGFITIDTREPHLEKNLLVRGGNIDVKQVDYLG